MNVQCSEDSNRKYTFTLKQRNGNDVDGESQMIM